MCSRAPQRKRKKSLDACLSGRIRRNPPQQPTKTRKFSGFVPGRISPERSPALMSCRTAPSMGSGLEACTMSATAARKMTVQCPGAGPGCLRDGVKGRFRIGAEHIPRRIHHANAVHLRLADEACRTTVRLAASALRRRNLALASKIAP